MTSAWRRTVGVILPLAAIAVGVVGAERCVAGHYWIGFAALAGSVVLLLADPVFWRDSEGVGRSRQRRQWVPLVAVLGAMLFFRCYRIVPPGLWGDDAINGLLAFDILDGKIGSPLQLIRHSHSYFHAWSNYLIAFAFAVLGPGLAALRVPGVLLGCVVGLSVYGIARRLFDRNTALVAGLLVASSPMQISHAKILIQVVHGLAMQCVGFYFLVRAVYRSPSTQAEIRVVGSHSERRNWMWLALSAVFFAATVYTYHSAKVAPLVALPLIVGAVRSGVLDRRHAVFFAAVLAVCMLPGAWSYWENPKALLSRANAVSLRQEVVRSGSLMPLLASAWKTLGTFHVEQGPTRYHWFGPGSDPALTLIPAALVLHGVTQSLLRFRQPHHQALLFWFAVGCVPAALSTDAPRVYRTIMATPPIFIWAAMPLAAMFRRGRILRFVAVMLVAATMVFDFNYYFHRVYTHAGVRWMHSARIVELARIVRDQGGGWTGYVMASGTASHYESLRFLSRLWRLDLRDVGSLGDALALDPLPERGGVFLTTPGTHVAGRVLDTFFSDTSVVARYDPPVGMWWDGASWPYRLGRFRSDAIASALIVPRSSLEKVRSKRVPLPVEVECRSGEESFKFRDVMPLYDFGSDIFPYPVLCVWRATLAMRRSGRIRVRSNHGVKVFLDGLEYDEKSKIDPGRYQLELRGTEKKRRIRLKVYRDGPGGATLVPRWAWSSPSPRR